MKKLLILIILISLTAGCGIYDLNFFVMPDDLEFLALVKELDTPQKIVQYMSDNFEYEAHALWTPTPYIIWQTKKVDCNDFVTFAIFIANYHNYETYQIEIFWKNTIDRHMLAVYKEDKYSFSDCEIYCSARYNTFLEIVEYDCWLRDKDWTKYIVYNYWNDIVEEVYNN